MLRLRQFMKPVFAGMFISTSVPTPIALTIRIKLAYKRAYQIVAVAEIGQGDCSRNKSGLGRDA